MASVFRRPMEAYEGRHVGCAPGTHAALCALIDAHARRRDDALDIGAHAGALLLRLRALGFQDLTGTDLDETRFDVPGAAFLKLELNGPFAEAFDQGFDLIACTDVIEHLDSPRDFLRQAHGLLREDGLLALSFPNVAFWEGRLKFLLKGELWGFGRKNYVKQRHISPMTLEQTELMLREIGYEVLALTSAGSFATPLKTALSAPLWGPIRLLGGPSSLGESVVLLARKASGDEDLKRPLHYRSRWSGTPDSIGLQT